ncbi:histidine phosphatase family protein [Gorillibacterium massiliense]|uniref:histidine phosphatase family protein n=1 Tax=Gorillibacterium massiliense TaxID=1280390 RepID=UPI0004B87899|nr:histidine phosphatase family protein [Gorillibacterium massiliense]
MTTFGIIRHGETDWNREKRAQGITDVPLNEEGFAQARKLAVRLSEEKWDMIYTSDLVRAKATAELIAEALGIEVRVDVRLREKTHGRLDGTTVEERIERWGEGWRELDHEEESRESIVARSMALLDELTERYPDKRILLVSHGAWIVATLETLLNPEELVFIGNTSICVLEHQKGVWTSSLIGCTKHLDEK